MHILFVLFVIVFISCGYEPISSFANKTLGDRVFVNLIINLENPEDSIIAKDIMNKVIISRFHANISSKEDADSIINMTISNINNSVIATDSKGLATFYRLSVEIDFSFKRDSNFVNYKDTGYYDYATLTQNLNATNTNREFALREAILQAVNKFVSRIAYEGAYIN